MSRQASHGQLRSFGVMFAAFFLIVGLYPAWHHAPVRVSCLVVAAVIAAVAVLFPGILRRPYSAWMAFGEVLMFVNSRVLLGVTYFLLFAPTGLVLRLLGKDPMKRRFEPGLQTYRMQRQPRPASHMEHQF